MGHVQALYLGIAVLVYCGKGGMVQKVITVADGKRQGPIIEIGHK